MRCAALLALLVPAGLLLSGAALAQPQMPVLLAPLPSGDNRADELPPLEGPTISRSGVVALNADVLAQYFTDRAEGRTLRAIADGLNAEVVPTARGGRWHASTVKAVVASLALDTAALEARAA